MVRMTTRAKIPILKDIFKTKIMENRPIIQIFIYWWVQAADICLETLSRWTLKQQKDPDDPDS